jgi:hypothetical protein
VVFEPPLAPVVVTFEPPLAPLVEELVPVVPLLDLLSPPLAPLLEPPLLLLTVSSGGPPPLPPEVGGVSDGQAMVEAYGRIVPGGPPGNGVTPGALAK